MKKILFGLSVIGFAAVNAQDYASSTSVSPYEYTTTDDTVAVTDSTTTDSTTTDSTTTDSTSTDDGTNDQNTTEDSNNDSQTGDDNNNYDDNNNQDDGNNDNSDTTPTEDPLDLGKATVDFDLEKLDSVEDHVKEYQRSPST